MNLTGMARAGGRGPRMGGVDKRRQPFRGMTMTASMLRSQDESAFRNINTREERRNLDTP